MIKVKEFWNFYCNEKNVRFFSGVPTKFFKQVYDTMDKASMFYVPAVNANVALGIVSGASLSTGVSGLFLSSGDVLRISYDLCKFNMELGIPLIIWTDPYSDFSDLCLDFNVVNNNNFRDFDHGLLVVENGFKK